MRFYYYLLLSITLTRYDCVMEGHLYKRCSDSNKWLQRWFKLYQVFNLCIIFSQFEAILLQNLLFYYESENTARPSGVIFLEVLQLKLLLSFFTLFHYQGCYCERLVTPNNSRHTDAGDTDKVVGSQYLLNLINQSKHNV